MTELKEGTKAPEFEGIDQNGNIVSLGDFKGKKSFSTSILRMILRVYCTGLQFAG
jgi:hypothetical protein